MPEARDPSVAGGSSSTGTPPALPADEVVGFIGAGRIGMPMVERLRGAGHSVRVYARRPEVRARLGELDAQLVATVEQLGECSIVLSCLYNDEQLAELGPRLLPQLAPGSVFVSHTTGTPSTLAELARRVAPQGIGVVEAPFSGSADDVQAGVLAVFLGGEGPAVDRTEAVIRAYADPVLRTGALGTALAVKLLNNALFGAISQLTLVAMAAAESMSIEEAQLLRALQVGSGGSRAAERIARLGGSGPFAERVGEFLRKDLAAAEALAEELGLDIAPIVRTATDGPLTLHRGVQTDDHPDEPRGGLSRTTTSPSTAPEE
jgi:3-hydroxyisobutyrate dehydrogenase-like beta-hydroxyacid dehydrogenase